MIIDPKTVTYKACYKLLTGAVVPRPIALVSTVSSVGVPNLAPFSFFTAITSSPPTICFAPGRRSGGGRKDTLANVESTGEFVVNIVNVAMGEGMNEAATDFPPEVDEFDKSGFTPSPSVIVRPSRVAESPINMECRLLDVIAIGPEREGGGSLVIGEVVMFHVRDALYDSGKIDIVRLDPLGRLAGFDYTTLGTIIRHPRKRYEPKS